jgi:hypothetical protein
MPCGSDGRADFGKGMRPAGVCQSVRPSTLEPQRGSRARLCGLRHHRLALAELPHDSASPSEGGGGNIMVQFIGRTVASGHALQYVIGFVINDDGTWVIRRPQEFPRAELVGLIASAQAGRLVELYECSRVRVADRRVDVPRVKPFIPPFNKWSTNLLTSGQRTCQARQRVLGGLHQCPANGL